LAAWLEPASYSAKRVLEIYKFQPFLEKRHPQLKTWQDVTPVLLRKDDPVVAYLHMHEVDDQSGTHIHLDVEADKLVHERRHPDFLKARLGNNE